MQCKYPGCGREEKRDQCCIFHLRNKTAEEAAEFYRELVQYKKRKEEDPSARCVDLEGFFFPGHECIFRDEHFKKDALFDDATFGGDVSFDSATFDKEASFAGAMFSGRASFVGATFSGGAWFDDTIFSGYAFFNSVLFSTDATFDSATFTREALFLGAAFDGDASFRDATFGGDAFFEHATFSRHASFVDVTFGKDAMFFDVTFKNLLFHKAVLLGNVRLGARFDGIAVFEKVVFQRDTIESSDLATATRGNIGLSVTSFDGAYVSEGAEVRFIQQREYNASLDVERNLGIDRVSFLNVDLERFNFQQVEWGTLHGRRAVIEEVLMGRPPFEDVTPEQVRQICARLRANQEKALRYAEAGDFFIGEMDMRRRWLRERGWRAFPERFLLSLFSGLSRYGESISRPALATVIIVFVLVGLRLVLREPSEWHPYQPLSVEESLVRSVASFFQLRTTTLWTDILERLVSIPILGVLFIALRRKLERRS